jgi:outer membrane lipoprotein-sorting protein
MELTQLLELLYTAHERCSTVSVTWTYTYDAVFLDRLLRAGRQMLHVVGDEPSTQGKGQAEVWWRIWWQKPARFREEYGGVEDPQPHGVTVVDGERVLILYPRKKRAVLDVVPTGYGSYIADKSKRSPQGLVRELAFRHILLYPAALLASHDLRIRGLARHLNRNAIQVEAKYRSGATICATDDFFWRFADRYKLLVDSEYGTLLSYAAEKGGKTIAVARVTQIAYDDMIPDDIFSTTVPPGFRGARGSHRLTVGKVGGLPNRLAEIALRISQQWHQCKRRG